MKPTVFASILPRPDFKLLVSWLVLCGSIALHVTDEATHNFLAVYNPSIVVLRGRVPWLWLPVFTFRGWIASLSIFIALLVLLGYFLARGARWVRPIFFAISLVMIANGVQHTVGTVLGRTVASVHFPRPMPGFYSSPVLIVASVYVLVQLCKTRQSSLQP